MNQGDGLLSKFFAWGISPLNDDTTLAQWAGGLVVVLALAFLWSTVVKQVVEA